MLDVFCNKYKIYNVFKIMFFEILNGLDMFWNFFVRFRLRPKGLRVLSDKLGSGNLNRIRNFWCLGATG